MNYLEKISIILDYILHKIMRIFCLIILIYSIYCLIDTLHIYKKALPNNLQKYKPTIELKDEAIPNFDSIKELNKDVIGWITIDNTKIDYPIVIGKDNSEYLNKSVDKTHSISGSIFLDTNNKRDFSDSYSVIYGHNMRNGAMFGDIKKYLNSKMFSTNSTGTLITPNKVYKLEVLALIKVDSHNKIIYNKTATNKVIDYIKKNHINYNYKNKNLDKLISLSTCTSGTNQRLVLIVTAKE